MPARWALGQLLSARAARLRRASSTKPTHACRDPHRNRQARVHKSAEEVEVIRYVNRIGSLGHVAMMQARRAAAGARGEGRGWAGPGGAGRGRAQLKEWAPSPCLRQPGHVAHWLTFTGGG